VFSIFSLPGTQEIGFAIASSQLLFRQWFKGKRKKLLELLWPELPIMGPGDLDFVQEKVALAANFLHLSMSPDSRLRNWS
jgi:hypothetical protein